LVKDSSESLAYPKNVRC